MRQTSSVTCRHNPGGSIVGDLRERDLGFFLAPVAPGPPQPFLDVIGKDHKEQP